MPGIPSYYLSPETIFQALLRIYADICFLKFVQRYLALTFPIYISIYEARLCNKPVPRISQCSVSSSTVWSRSLRAAGMNTNTNTNTLTVCTHKIVHIGPRSHRSLGLFMHLLVTPYFKCCPLQNCSH